MFLKGIKTVWLDLLIQHMLAGKPYYPPINTTLNERFKRIMNFQPDPYVYPNFNIIVAGYEFTNNLGIGNKLHSPIHASVYNPLPFKLLKDNEYLTPEEENLYRLKSTIILDNISYTAYYGIKLSDTTTSSLPYYLPDMTGESNVTFDTVNYPELLYPSTDDKYDGYALVSNVISIDLTSTVLANLKEVSDIFKSIYGNDIYISELGLCTGVETPDDENKPESAWTQIGLFLNTNLDIVSTYMKNMETGIPYTINIEVGGLNIIKLST